MRPSRILAALALLAAPLACHKSLQVKADPKAAPQAMAEARAAAEAGRHAPRPLTRAERTKYFETSRVTDVYTFLDSLARLGAPITEQTIGRSAEGADLPFIIAARPAIQTPEQARATGKPIVYVQANIHAGEVEGKEALMMLLRDLTLDPRPNVLDSIVLLAQPIYNADGNEKVQPQTINRTEQNGPILVGQRPNAQGLDLNRDYMKAEAPETRASLAAFNRWDPDVFVDLHTTDGSYHGYALTYSPSLHPGAPLRAFNQDTLLPELERRVRARRKVETYPYGNFTREGGARSLVDSVKRGWETYDSHSRFGTNYYGLRGKLSILSEAFSHDPFETRVEATYAFVREMLTLVAEQGPGIVRRTRQTARPTEGVLRAKLTASPYTAPVKVEVLVRAADSMQVTQPGVPRGLQRTGRILSQSMPVYDRFDATLRQSVPAGGWAFDATQAAAVSVLRAHGVRVERADSALSVQGELFVADSVVVSPRPFQGHNEVRLEGRWRATPRTIALGGYFVPADQPLALVALTLLEPQSDDGLATWGIVGKGMTPGSEFPVVRVTAVPNGKRTPVP